MEQERVSWDVDGDEAPGQVVQGPAATPHILWGVPFYILGVGEDAQKFLDWTKVFVSFESRGFLGE